LSWTKLLKAPVLSNTAPSFARVSALGTRGSGKSTSLGLLHLTAIARAQQNARIKYRVRERTLGQREVASDLCDGHFPPSTPMGTTFEADMLIRWESRFGSRQVETTFVDCAGEEIQGMLERFNAGIYEIRDMGLGGRELHEKVLMAQHFIVIAPVIRVNIATLGRLEREPDALPENPDVNLARLIDAIYDYKKRTSAPPVKSIAILLTKYDQIATPLLAHGMNLQNNQGLLDFLHVHFRETYNALNWFGLDKVAFFPSWVDLKQVNGGYVQHPRGGWTIDTYPENYEVKHLRKMPKFSYDTYSLLVDWMETFAS